MKKLLLLALFTLLFSNKVFSQDGYIGEIRMFAGNFAPVNWMLCQGQILPIAQNTALFSILGTTYGGNGQTTFALPDLRGRVPIGVGQGAGLSLRNLGDMAGTENVTLTVNQMPAHTHLVNAVTSVGNQNSPTGNFLADTNVLDKEYSNSASNTTMNPAMLASAGGNQPFSIMQPYLGMNYIICVAGIYPSRP